MHRTLKFSLVSLGLNIVYSAYHIVYGAATNSQWFLAIGVYYIMLSIIRLAVIRPTGKKHYTIRFTGIMLVILSVSLIGTVVLAYIKDRGTQFPLIIMLAIATYTFTKITLATIEWIKSRKCTSTRLIALRNISFADAVVSICSLQRSMLVSFQGMSLTEIRIMNLATGSAVCIIIFLLGVNLIQSKQFNKQ